MAWYNFDDLDIHVKEPTGNEIYYSNKKSKTGGFLDIDMNAGGASSREAVENVCWNNPPDGDYVVYVNNYSKRESIDVGFALEVENNGSIHSFSYEKPVNGKVKSLVISVKNGGITSIKTEKDVSGGSVSQENWGIQTEQFAKVNVLMNSPNHWEGSETGNKHLFFIIDGCKNPDKARGFYNEFLTEDLRKHRKTFEILAAKTKCEESENQLSGLGFSSTKKESVLIKAHGNGSRLYNVQF